MNEREFLESLGKGLRGHPERDEILDEMREHFRAGRGAGRGESEMAESLGDPVALAREFRAVGLAARTGERPGPAASFRLACHALALRFPGPAGAAAAGALGLMLGALLLFLALALAGGLSSLAGALYSGLHPDAARDLGRDLRSAGSGLLALAGILGLLSALVESGKRSRAYIQKRAAPRGDA